MNWTRRTQPSGRLEKVLNAFALKITLPSQSTVSGRSALLRSFRWVAAPSGSYASGTTIIFAVGTPCWVVRLWTFGIHEHKGGEFPFLLEAVVVIVGDAAGQRLPWAIVVLPRLDYPLFDSGRINLIHDCEDPALDGADRASRQPIVAEKGMTLRSSG